jgi:hypothetical protein
MNKRLIKMKLQDAERAMRTAAHLEDFEQALSIREEVRKLREALEDAPEPEMKVVDLFTREEYAPDILDETDTSPTEYQEVINLFDDFLDMAKEGKITSAAVYFRVKSDDPYEPVSVDFTDGVYDVLPLYQAATFAQLHDFVHLQEDMDIGEEFDEFEE